MVGSTEAQAIALQLENIAPPRPLTHDLIRNLLDVIQVRITRIVVNDLRENTYYALLNLVVGSESKDIDARPSDAIAVALRMKAPIYVEEEVMRKAAIVEGETPIIDIDDDVSEGDRLEQLNIELNTAVQDERYEEAARIRDEIKKVKASYREKTSS